MRRQHRRIHVLSTINEEFIEKAIAHTLSVDPQELTLTAQTLLFEDLGFDSMKLTALALYIEAELGTPVLLSDWLNAHTDPSHLTVGSLLTFLNSAS